VTESKGVFPPGYHQQAIAVQDQDIALLANDWAKLTDEERSHLSRVILHMSHTRLDTQRGDWTLAWIAALGLIGMRAVALSATERANASE